MVIQQSQETGFGFTLRRAVKEARMSRERLAENLQCSSEAVDSWCCGRSRISPMLLHKLCSFLAAKGVNAGLLKQMYESALADHGFSPGWPPREIRATRFTLCLLGSLTHRKELAVMRMISDYLRGTDQTPLIFDCGDSVDTLLSYLRVAREIDASNIILCGLSLPHDIYRLALDKAGNVDTFVIFMLTDCPAEIVGAHKNAYAVSWSDYDLAYKAVTLLIEAGHTRIGTVHLTRYAARFQAYVQALKDNGIEPDPRTVIHGGDLSGYPSIIDQDFMLNLERFVLRDDVSAFFASTELLSLAVPVLLLKNGRVLHRDISLCGMAYSDWIGGGLHLPITYVCYPTDAVAHQVLDILLRWSITGRGFHENRYVDVSGMATRVDIGQGSIRRIA